MEDISLYSKARQKFLKNELEEAFNFYNKGFEQGEIKCAFGLAVCYYYGEGIKKDVQFANQLFNDYYQPILNLAETGDSEAQYIMCLYYSRGYSIPKMEKEAVKWCEKSANSGYLDAQNY